MGTLTNSRCLWFAAACAAVLLWQCVLGRPGVAYRTMMVSLWSAGLAYCVVNNPGRLRSAAEQSVVNAVTVFAGIIILAAFFVGLVFADHLVGRFFRP